MQSGADAEYFLKICGRGFRPREMDRVHAGVLKAYRWQYIGSGVENPRFVEILGSMITPQQAARIGAALAPIVGDRPAG